MIDAPDQHVRLLMIGARLDRRASWLSVGSPAEALRRVRASGPRAVVFHLDGTGAAAPCIEVLEELRRRRPEVALLVLASHGDERVERMVRAAGAHCYVHGGAELVRTAEVLAGVVRQGVTPRTAPIAPRPPEARANGPPGAPAPAPGAVARRWLPLNDSSRLTHRSTPFRGGESNERDP